MFGRGRNLQPTNRNYNNVGARGRPLGRTGPTIPFPQFVTPRFMPPVLENETTKLKRIAGCAPNEEPYIEAKTQEGVKYYYHPVTRETFWEKPSNAKIISTSELCQLKQRCDAEEQFPPKGFGIGKTQAQHINDAWIEMTAPDGRKHYFNSITKENIWNKPEALIKKDIQMQPDPIFMAAFAEAKARANMLSAGLKEKAQHKPETGKLRSEQMNIQNKALPQRKNIPTHLNFVNQVLKENNKQNAKVRKHSADSEESLQDAKRFKETPSKAPKSLKKERASIILALRELKKRHCPDDCSRLMVLEERDKLLYKLKAIVDKYPQASGKKQMNATLNSMCTEKERYSRAVQKRISIFECSKEGKICPNKLIKEYSRSAAQQEKPLPHELRRPDMLHYTMLHLLTNVLDILPGFEEQGQWYSFLWDRTRAIRKEITQIMLSNRLAASLLECCTRFHILCSYLLCSQNVENFDQKMNTENLVKCLQTLRHLYDDLAKQGIFCANEAEFRAYDVLLHLHDNNVLRQVLSYRKEIREDPIVRHAIQLACALQSNNFSRFFRLLRTKSSYLQCCICHRFFIQVRSKAIDTLNCAVPRDSTGNKTLNLEYLIKLLAFDNKVNALQFLEGFGIRQNVKKVEEVIIAKNKINMDCDPKLTTYLWIDEKTRCNLSEIVYGGPLMKPNRLPVIDDSFDENGYYSKDPVLENIFKNVSNINL